MTIYGKILSLICLADLVSTVIGIEAGFFIEANPILAISYRYAGTLGLLFQKILMNLCSIFVLEMAVRFSAVSEKKMKTYYKAVIIAYIVFYLVSVIIVNYPSVFR